MKILITGGTGLIGKALVEKLKEKGHTANVLVRNKTKNENEFFWNYQNKEIEEKAFEDVDSIIHLAGASIGKRWTNQYKKEIISTRVDSANFLFEKCEALEIHLKSFISASGINYYGTFTSDKILTENDGVLHQDFLSEVCEKWEDSAQKFEKISERTVVLRTSPVLSEHGGSFEQLKIIADYNLASGIGSGKQFFNWIHLDDMVNMYVFALENPQINGIYNAVADDIRTNREFMRVLAKANNKFFIPLNVPTFLMKLVLGEMSEMILEGTRVSNKKIKSQGFDFKYSDLDVTLKQLLK